MPSDWTLGGWSGDDLTLAAQAIRGLGVDAGLDPALRFQAAVAQLVRTRHARLRQNPIEADTPRVGIFLLHPGPPKDACGMSIARRPMLSNGLSPLAGRLWFVNELAEFGHYCELQQDDDDEIFGLVTERLGLGSLPAVVLDPRLDPPQARFYPQGLVALDNHRLVPLADRDLPVGEVFDIIDRVHGDCLITPSAQVPRARNLWEDGIKWWPSDRAEALIQADLKAGLVAALPTFKVRHEQPGVPGRTDLEIERSDALDRSRVTRYVVLELKVLRSYGSTGLPVSATDNSKAIRDGVAQAATYRTDKGARSAALCCFDMRSESAATVCFEGVSDLASEKGITLRRWFLYSTDERFRAAHSQERRAH